MCLSLYSLASMNFYDQEYFESVFFGYLDQSATPHIDQLSFIAQSCAILRRAEYTETLVQWFKQTLEDQQFNLFENPKDKESRKWEAKNEQRFVSALQAIVYLAGTNEQFLNELKQSQIQQCIDQIGIDFSQSHLTLMPSFLWSLMCLDLLPQNVGLLKKCLTILSECHEMENYISFPGAVLLNQVLNHIDLESLEQRHFDDCLEIFDSSQRDYI